MSIVRQFLLSSSIPGVKYIGDNGVGGTASRLAWFLLIWTNFVFAIVFMLQSYFYWEEHPIVVFVESYSYPLKDIQYPTVIICPTSANNRWSVVEEILDPINYPCGEDATDCDKLAEEDFKEVFAKIKDDIRSLYERNPKITISEEITKKISSLLVTLEAQNGSLPHNLEKLIDDAILDDKKQLLAPYGVDDIYKAIDNSDPELSSIKYFPLAKKTAFYLFAFPSRVLLGKFLALAGPWSIGRSLSDSFIMEVNEHNMFNDYQFSTAEYSFLRAFENIFRSATNDPYANISLFEVPAMLQEIRFSPSKMFMLPPLYSYWYSVSRLPADQYTKRAPNFFGKLLSKYKKVVTRILLYATDAMVDQDLPSFHLPYSSNVKNLAGIMEPKGIRPKYIPMATFCDSCFGSEEKSNVPFRPVLTDRGVCSAFNAVPIHQAFNLKDSELLNLLAKNASDVVVMEYGGDWSKLNLILRTSRFLKPAALGPFFSLTLQNSHGFTNTMADAISIDVGYQYDIKVTPVQHVTSEDFRDFPVKVRQCRYLDENPLGDESMFTYYTKNTCLYECLIRVNSEKTGCLPWYYPSRNKSVDYCDGYLTNAYEKNIDPWMYDQCDCLPDCEEVVFQHSTTSHSLDSELLCNTDFNIIKRTDARKFTLTQASEYGDALITFLTMYSLYKGESNDFLANITSRKRKYDYLYEVFDRYSVKLCKEVMTKQLAQVSVEVSVPSVTRIMKQKRATFSDKLGSLGE